ncbi:NAD(P)H-dependent flavin oxidoreductase [Chryseomicrobium aureum]|uniref:Probable nitronate monooxygenase n=1 Tax=Tetzosporium hominis TaxID=2020506 RepID=A0A264W3H7_9BACL|nr:nitronate monooxygenase [Tetzosporium hominis]OZS78129.1 nitronate monooxygenase [Tetzosporium hominis]
MYARLELPVIVAPMFLVSSPELVIASCRNGLIGSIPLLNARTKDQCEEWLQQLSKELSELPWAVNYICHRTNRRLEEDLELIQKYQPPVVIASLGHPGKVVKVVQSYGGKVFADVANLRHAQKAAESGVDGLILVSAGAGGHAGIINPFAFVSAVREFWRGTLILAGGISTGQDILAAQVLGADLVYMGTRFIATQESIAFPEYKEMLTKSTTEDILYTDAFSGVHANYLIPSLKNNHIDPSTLKKKESVDLGHMIDPKAWRDIWSAGHGVTVVKETQPVSTLIQTLKGEYMKAKEKWAVHV